jgi:hypothetical protein
MAKNSTCHDMHVVAVAILITADTAKRYYFISISKAALNQVTNENM